MCLNVRRFPPPSSRTYQLHYIGAGSPGGRRDTLSESPRCWVGSRCWEDRASRKWRETASGCPKRWCWSKRRTGGDGRLAAVAPGSRRGGCRPRGSGGVAPFAWRPKPAAIRHVWGGAGNGGLAAGCPRPEEPPPSARRRMSIGPSTKEVSTIACTASEPLSWLRTERQCVREPDRDFFFLSPLSRLCHSSSFRLLSLASSVLTPRYAAAALTGSPRERGEGGSRAQSREYPPACEGRWGVCDEWGGAESRGNGARPVEWMIMNDTCATHRSRVPRRSFGRNKRRSDDIGRRERTRPGFYFMFCVWQSSVRGCRFSVMFVYLIKCV